MMQIVYIFGNNSIALELILTPPPPPPPPKKKKKKKKLKVDMRLEMAFLCTFWIKRHRNHGTVVTKNSVSLAPGI